MNSYGHGCKEDPKAELELTDAYKAIIGQYREDMTREFTDLIENSGDKYPHLATFYRRILHYVEVMFGNKEEENAGAGNNWVQFGKILLVTFPF